MVDSGNQIQQGYASFYQVYQSMVDTALARPPQAEIQASWWRTGNQAEFYVQVHNLHTVTLSSEVNGAAVHAIVYEEARVGVTGRFGRAAVESGITSLAPDGSATFRLGTADLGDVNWDKLFAVVLVDYRPSGLAGRCDMLQAAVAERKTDGLTARPETVYLPLAVR